MSRLCEGRIAIITGAGRGVGRQHAIQLAAHGAKIVVNDIGADIGGAGGDASPANEVVETIRANGGEAVVNGNDCSSWTGAKAMVEQAVDTFGGLDIVVNNAGILRDRMLTNMTEEEWDLVMNVNLKGQFLCCKYVLPHMIAQKAGKIVNIGSTSGREPAAALVHYA